MSKPIQIPVNLKDEEVIDRIFDTMIAFCTKESGDRTYIRTRKYAIQVSWNDGNGDGLPTVAFWHIEGNRLPGCTYITRECEPYNGCNESADGTCKTHPRVSGR